MEVAEPPAGYNLINIPIADMEAAMVAYNTYMAVWRGLEQELILRGVHVEINGRFPVELLEPAEAAQYQEAVERWMGALDMIREYAGVEIGAVRLILQRNPDGEVVGAQVYRPPDEVMMNMVLLNEISANTTTTTTTLPQESSSLSSGQIFGITVGSVAGAAAIAAAVLIWIRRRRRQPRPSSLV